MTTAAETEGLAAQLSEFQRVYESLMARQATGHDARTAEVLDRYRWLYQALALGESAGDAWASLVRLVTGGGLDGWEHERLGFLPAVAVMAGARSLATRVGSVLGRAAVVRLAAYAAAAVLAMRALMGPIDRATDFVKANPLVLIGAAAVAALLLVRS